MLRIWIAVSLVLLAISATSARALAEAEATASPSDSDASLSEEFESDEECIESDEEETDTEEGECEAEADDTSFSPAEDCYLRTARARVVAYPSRDIVRLTVGYTTYTPAQATVEYGAKGDPHLGAVRRQLGRSGVVRLSKHLDSSEMAKLQGSRRFTVTVHVPEAPSVCQRFEVQRLQVEHSSTSRVTWSEDH